MTSTKITKSSGNVFADLGLPDADTHLLKAHLVRLIGKIIEGKKLSQGQAAAVMGIRQPDVSKLLRGRFEGFSLERLLIFVRALGSDIEIKVKPSKQLKQEKPGRMSIAA